MPGQYVEATLWEVVYRHLSAECEKPPEPRARSLLSRNPIVAQLQAQAAAASAEGEGAPYVHGRVLVLTADPSGEDLLQVARCAVLGMGGPTHDFSLVQVQRMADSVKGIALVRGEGAS